MNRSSQEQVLTLIFIIQWVNVDQLCCSLYISVNKVITNQRIYERKDFSQNKPNR